MTPRDAPTAASGSRGSVSWTAVMGPSPASMSRMPPRTRAPRTRALMSRRLLGRLGRGGAGLDDDGRAIGHDLGHRVREPARVEAHGDDGVRAHDRGGLDQSVEGLAAGVLPELGGVVELAAGE